MGIVYYLCRRYNESTRVGCGSRNKLVLAQNDRAPAFCRRPAEPCESRWPGLSTATARTGPKPPAKNRQPASKPGARSIVPRVAAGVRLGPTAFILTVEATMPVLLLNATYEPMHVVSLRRAVALMLQERAQLVEASERMLRSPAMAMPEPSVIRLCRVVRTPRRWSVPLSRAAILARDGYTCLYCGDQPGLCRLTVDHVLPVSRGGAWAWTNLATACLACNAAKGCRTPEEASMILLRQPGKPHFTQLALLGSAQQNPVWQPYLWSG